MAYTYEPLFAADPNNPAMIAKDAAILIFNPAIPGVALTITDPTGSPLPNPITVNAAGFGPAFQHATLDRVGWDGGGFEGFLTSYEGMKTVATDAQTAAEAAAANAGKAATDDVAARIAAGEFAGAKGADGTNGANVLPTDDAIEQAINTAGTKTKAALNATYVRGLNVTAHGAKGDGTADDTAAFNAAITAATGKEIYVPVGTYLVHNILIEGTANLRLADGAKLVHKPGAAAGAMFNFRPTASRFKLRGGIIDGNRANQTGRPYIFIGALQSGKSFDVEDVEFTGTIASIAYISDFGGYLNFSRNKVLDQAQHSGTGSEFTTTVTVVSGQPGVRGFIRTSYNYCYWDGTPARAGSNPGGFFVNTTTIGGDDADGNLTTWEAIGNYFYGYGQHDSVNDISPLHTYPTIQGARFIGNYFEQCGFCAVSAKSVQDFVFTGNVIVDGMVSAKNTASEGAISYVPGYKAGAFQRQKAVISGNIVKNPGGQETLGQNCISVHGITTSRAGDVIISDNILEGYGAGINVQYTDNIKISGNYITTVNGTGSAGTGIGIRFSHIFGDVQVTGNTIETTNGDGINAITGVDTARFEITNNRINQNSTSRYGMILRGMDYLKLSGNTIDNPAGPALNIQADAGTNKVGHLAYTDDNTFVSGAVSISWAGVDAASGQLAAGNSPVNTVTPAVLGTTYRQTNGAGDGILWMAQGLTASSWTKVLSASAGAAGANKLLGMTFDPVAAVVAQAASTSGVLQLAKVQMLGGGAVSKVFFQVAAPGAGLVAGQCFIGVYDSAGNLIGQSPDVAADFAGAGNKTVTLSTPTASLTPGAEVFLALLWNGTTSPQIRGINGSSIANIGIGAVADYRFSTAGSAQTALPATLPAKAAATVAPWFGVA